MRLRTWREKRWLLCRPRRLTDQSSELMDVAVRGTLGDDAQPKVIIKPSLHSRPCLLRKG